MLRWSRWRLVCIAIVLAVSGRGLMSGAIPDVEHGARDLTLAQADEAMTILKLFCGRTGLDVRYEGPCGMPGNLTRGRVWGPMASSGSWLIYEDGESGDRRCVEIAITPRTEAQGEAILSLKESECHVVTRSAGVGFDVIAAEEFRFRDGRTLPDVLRALSEFSRAESARRRVEVDWSLLDAADDVD